MSQDKDFIQVNLLWNLILIIIIIPTLWRYLEIPLVSIALSDNVELCSPFRISRL